MNEGLKCIDCPPGRVHTSMSDHPFRAQPQGKSRKELLPIVEADNRRFHELGEIWDLLSEAQQLELIATAREMVKD